MYLYTLSQFLIYVPIYGQSVFCDSSGLIVDLPLGKIEGSAKVSVNGKEFYSFEGVPYAKPPIGKFRFDEPKPLQSWSGIRKANQIYKCLQYRHLNQPSAEDPVVGDEDCLYLNIYTPDLNTHANLDVIVFFHGGAFMFNYGAFQGPGILMNHDIVFVTLNYRLGPLGFLSTEDDVVPGNNGLKDQIAALQWIQKNIRYFGGNPDSVTVAGNSAGGASVHLHYLMKQSRGLFHKGFSQSGTALNSWVLAEKPLQKSKKIASLVNCTNGEITEMIECMRQKEGRRIVETVQHFQPWLYNPFSPFAVVVDSWSSQPLLEEHPYQLLKKKMICDAPWIASHVSSEGLYPAAEFYSNTSHLSDINTGWQEIIPHILHYNDVLRDGTGYIGRKIRQYYLDNEDISRATFDKLVQAIGDRLFVVDIHKAVKLHAEAMAGPVYMYYFTYRGKTSRSVGRSGSEKDFGAAHGDDASYLMQMKLDTLSTEEDRNMSKLLTEMWISVSSTGKPHISEWKPVDGSRERINYLKIASPSELGMSDEKLGNMQFWNSLPFMENEKLFASSAKDEL